MYRVLRLHLQRTRFSFMNFYSVDAVQDSVPQKRGNLNFLHKFTSQFENPEFIEEMIQKDPQLERTKVADWKKIVDTCVKFNFEVKDCLMMISKYPEILKIPQEELHVSMLNWHNCINEEDLLQLILTTQPHFLELDEDTLGTRLAFFIEYGDTHEAAATLIANCPNVMTEEWSFLIEKMQYLLHEVIVERKEIFSCCALAKTLDHLKIRFTILERCGGYKRPPVQEHKKHKFQELKTMNPRLRDIVDSSDEIFVKIAGISLEEYIVFKDLYDTYQDGDQQSEGDSEFESDSDSDSE